MKRCVQASGMTIDQLRNDIDVSRLEFGQLPIFQDQARQFVSSGQLFENLYRRRILAGFSQLSRSRQVELVKKNLAELPGGVEVEIAVRNFADTPRQLLQLDAHLVGHPLQDGNVNL